MKRLCRLGLAGAALTCALLAGCAKKTTKKVTVETPEKKTEIEIEKTERK